MKSLLKTQVDMPIWADAVHLWFYERTEDGAMNVSSNLVMDKVPAGARVTHEPIALSRVSAQELMDQLWSIGFRPSQGSGSAGSLAATERHLEDMRTLVFQTQPKAK